MRSFRCVRINSEKRSVVSPFSVRPSVRMYERCSHSTDLCQILHWCLLRKSVDRRQILLKSEENIGQFTWRPNCVYIVDSSKKYSVAHQQCKRNPLKLFHCNTKSVYIVDSFHDNNGYANTSQCYMLGIESQWRWDFPHPSRPPPGAHAVSCTRGTGSPFKG